MLLPFIIFAAALFVDGATDCANSVTGAVSSGTMSLRRSVYMSSVLSFLGCVVFCLLFPYVAENSANAVSFSSSSASAAVIASLLSVALWSGAAWILGLPTSEGHALISASAGAALALGGKIFWPKLLRVIIWALPSALICALFSIFFASILKKAQKTSFPVPIILCSAVSSFFHGAQDGQKFLALALSASIITENKKTACVLVFALSMSFGTLFGSRIIKNMGTQMAVANGKSALASDLASALSLCLLTPLGIPQSTTHLKMISHTAAAKYLRQKTDSSTFALLICAWIATFPVCFALSFLLGKLFLSVFL